MSSRGCLPLPWRYIHVESMKICIKTDIRDFMKFATKWQSDKAFLVTLKFCPLWVVCPGAIYTYKSMKNMYKIRHQSFFKLATNGQSDKAFLLTLKFCPQGTVCPCPGAICMYKIIKNVYKIRLQRDFFLNL